MIRSLMVAHPATFGSAAVRYIATCCALAAIIPGATNAQGQGPIAPITPACGACMSRPVREYSISGTNSPLEGLPDGVVQDRRGRLLVWPPRLRPPMVFDARGRFLATLGRAGVGPGEVTPVRWIIAGDDDTLRVYANTRVNVFSGDLRYVRTYVERSPETGSEQVTRLPGGLTVRLSGRIPNRPGDLAPIYLRDSAGRLLRELSPTRGPVRPARALAAASAKWSTPLWVAESYFVDSDGYDVMLVDTLGRPRQTFRRRADWWHSRASAPGPGDISMADTIGRLPTAVVGVREDKRGRLLVLISHASDDWKGVTHADRFQERNYVSVLEVIDPTSHRLLASFRVNGFARALISDDRFVTYREDGDGYPHLDVWRINVP